MAQGTIVARSAAGERVDLRLIAALAAVWILWGSTFAAMHLAVSAIPPFAMASIRFTIAGLVLLAVAAARRKLRVTRVDLVRAVVTGATLLLFGNGMTAWTVQFLPTGLNSLLLSLAPVWMALIAFAWGGERPSRAAIAGMVLGLAGLALLLQSKSGGAFALWPAIVALLASISWAFGSIYQRRVGPTASLTATTSLQMIAGGILLGLEAALTGEWRHVGLASFTPESLTGLAWLIVCGSLIAYSAYLYTMQAANAALASTYAYVNPVVAVILGMVLFRERFTPVEAVAAAVILAGVALMMVPDRGFSRSASPRCDPASASP